MMCCEKNTSYIYIYIYIYICSILCITYNVQKKENVLINFSAMEIHD